MHDHCTAYDLRLGMSNVLTWGWGAAHISSICSTLTLGWIPEGKEVPGELTPLSQPLGTFFFHLSILNPSEQLASVLAPVH